MSIPADQRIARRHRGVLDDANRFSGKAQTERDKAKARIIELRGVAAGHAKRDVLGGGSPRTTQVRVQRSMKLPKYRCRRTRYVRDAGQLEAFLPTRMQ